MTGIHTISKAGNIYAGDVSLPNNQGGRIGAPIGNAIVRFKYEGLTPGTVVASFGTGAVPGQEYEINAKLAYYDSDYPNTSMGVVIDVASAANESGNTITLRGIDGAGWPATKTFALANIGSVESPIGWAEVRSYSVSAAPLGNCTITAIAKYSFPYAVWGDGDEISQMYLDGSAIAAPSFTTARTTPDTASGADGRGILDLTGESVSDSTLVWHQYVNRTSLENALGLKTFSDIPVANYFS